jgi:hypothetical protein
VAPCWWFPCKPKHVGAAFIILIYFNNSTFSRCVHQLDNNVSKNQSILFKEPASCFCIADFCVLVQSNMTDGFRRFGGKHCLHVQGTNRVDCLAWRNYILLKSCHETISLHGLVTQNATVSSSLLWYTPTSISMSFIKHILADLSP